MSVYYLVKKYKMHCVVGAKESPGTFGVTVLAGN